MNRCSSIIVILLCAVLLLGGSPPVFSATEFFEDLSGGLPGYMELGAKYEHQAGAGPDGIDFSGGNAAWQNVGLWRQYVRTMESDYSQVSFIFEGSVTLMATSDPDWEAGFFGVWGFE